MDKTNSPRAEAYGWALTVAILCQAEQLDGRLDLAVGTQIEAMAIAALAGYLWRWWRGRAAR